jgi:hypothetical protein
VLFIVRDAVGGAHGAALAFAAGAVVVAHFHRALQAAGVG